MRITVEIDNITEPQRIALCDLFAQWQRSGNLGCSRWTSFFSDGDGNFRPRITVGGEPVKFQDVVEAGKLWTRGEPWQGDYRIDPDTIAWKLLAEA